MIPIGFEHCCRKTEHLQKLFHFLNRNENSSSNQSRSNRNSMIISPIAGLKRSQQQHKKPKPRPSFENPPLQTFQFYKAKKGQQPSLNLLEPKLELTNNEKQNPIQTFSSEHDNSSKTNSISTLASALKSFGEIIPLGNIPITVDVEGIYEKSPITLHVSEDTTVKQTVNQLVNILKNKGISLGVKKFELAVIEDGEIDLGFELDSNSCVLNFGTTTFILVESLRNVSYDENGVLDEPYSLSTEDSVCSLKTVPTYHTYDPSFFKQSQFINIHWDNEVFKLFINPGMFLKDVLMIICEQKYIPVSSASFYLTSEIKEKIRLNTSVENPMELELPLDLYKTLIQYSIKNIRMIVDSRIKSLPMEFSDETVVFTYFFNEITATQYEEFPVIKINRYGTRQERIMGIDGHKVHNIIGKSSQILFLKLSKRPKTAAHFLRDIIKIRTNSVVSCIEKNLFCKDRVQSNHLKFYITYLENDEENEYHFECENVPQKFQILSKLKFLISLLHHDVHYEPIKPSDTVIYEWKPIRSRTTSTSSFQF
eukprot:TRINITY_DN13971_c0_g1_i1.p1 TRINITY_DN13971_c0_g1~~TRINITY_DN13971_c0_g1_i1.p1  ORF type:complete len:538 (+),score=106.05 TRINITY_DN13971_c0_g1_i1:49-1662(+)